MTEAKTAERKKLSVIPKGHWRNKWYSPLATSFHDGVEPAGTNIGVIRFPSEAAAREHAVAWKQDYAGDPEADASVYLGPVFFPD